MPKADRSANRGTGRSADVEVIWECCPNLRAQAQALLAFLGVDSEGMSASAAPTAGSPESGAQRERGETL
jgi:hypothetical protein